MQIHKMKSVVTIKGKPVIEIYESFDGSYWFITETCHKQDTVINGKTYKNDQILFGYVRLAACPEFAEWGYISETELKLLAPKVWKVPQKNWAFCPEVEVQLVKDSRKQQILEGRASSGRPLFFSSAITGGEI